MKIYIAGPYTKPDPCVNTNRAIMVANQLMDAGHIPFVPHLTHFWHTITPRPYEDWIKIDNEFLKCCDCLLRLDGNSEGADKEEELAKSLGIPVYYDIDDI
ncbi:MAG: DUF4406 domain-containing protein, partial [Candidatus Omnitrophica bacterium]|nr:DUF4406 domain-containing protein [Candidatus Omnitrophota bacterium]